MNTFVVWGNCYVLDNTPHMSPSSKKDFTNNLSPQSYEYIKNGQVSESSLKILSLLLKNQLLILCLFFICFLSFVLFHSNKNTWASLFKYLCLLSKGCFIGDLNAFNFITLKVRLFGNFATSIRHNKNILVPFSLSASLVPLGA